MDSELDVSNKTKCFSSHCSVLHLTLIRRQQVLYGSAVTNGEDSFDGSKPGEVAKVRKIHEQRVFA